MVKRQGMGWGGHFKGMVDDVTLRHYGVCDIYWEFGDTVYVTVPLTVICSNRMTAPTLREANRAPA